MSVSENVRREGHEPELGKFSTKYPLLVARAKHWGFDIPADAPMGVRVIVWRLPAIQATTTALWLPEDMKSPHVLGVLVAAGMKALDELESNGVSLGHYVKFERFAGWEHHDTTPEVQRGSRFLYLNSGQILSSVDLKDNLESGKVKYLRGEDGRTRLEMKLLPEDKKRKLLAVANDPGATPAERATARRIARKFK